MIPPRTYYELEVLRFEPTGEEHEGKPVLQAVVERTPVYLITEVGHDPRGD